MKTDEQSFVSRKWIPLSNKNDVKYSQNLFAFSISLASHHYQKERFASTQKLLKHPHTVAKWIVNEVVDDDPYVTVILPPSQKCVRSYHIFRKWCCCCLPMATFNFGILFLLFQWKTFSIKSRDTWKYKSFPSKCHKISSGRFSEN